jgi:hypothetical protein
MLNITIPAKFSILGTCGGRSVPKIVGSSYVFDATDEEYMFWNGLEASEKDNFILSTSGRCFLDVLHELMRTKRPGNYLESMSLS